MAVERAAAAAPLPVQCFRAGPALLRGVGDEQLRQVGGVPGEVSDEADGGDGGEEDELGGDQLWGFCWV